MFINFVYKQQQDKSNAVYLKYRVCVAIKICFFLMQ